MADLDALLDAALERKRNDPHTETATITVAGESLTLKFTELDSREWARCTIAHPPRLDVPSDVMFGYNLTAATEHAAPLSAVLVDGDEERKLTAEQWTKLFDGLEPHDRGSITDAAFAANEHAEIERLSAAKKAFEGASRRKRNSPAK